MTAEPRALPISRRCFMRGAGVAGLGLLAGCERLPWQEARPPRAPSTPRLGFLILVTLETSASVDSFRQGLRDHGWIEGQNIAVDYRSAGGAAERLPALAAELVNTHPDIIIAAPGTAAGDAASSATSTIPIVLLGHSDPVGQGLVASYARPGGNVTGLSGSGGPGIVGKRLEFLTAIVPGLSRVGLLWNPAESGQDSVLTSALAAAEVLGIEAQRVPLRAVEEFEPAFETLARAHAQGVYPLGANLFAQYRTRLADLAIEHKLPTVFSPRLFVDAGGLMAYAPNFEDLARRGAAYVDKILKGANPADLPIEQPMTFDFVINLKTAQALGLTIPQQVLLQATEVIR